jgi:TRAP-type mannitol/chloroaromatic compound transport system permease small subunit
MSSTAGKKAAAYVDQASEALSVAALVAASVCVLAIIVLGTLDTAGRAFWNAPVDGAVEMTESLLAAVIFLALPFAQRHSQHVVVDIIVQMLPRRWQTFLYLLALIATLAAFVLLAVQGVVGARAAWQVSEVSAGYIPVPIWLAKLLAAIGLVFASIETSRQIVFAALWPGQALARRVAEHVSVEQA